MDSNFSEMGGPEDLIAEIHKRTAGEEHLPRKTYKDVSILKTKTPFRILLLLCFYNSFIGRNPFFGIFVAFISWTESRTTMTKSDPFISSPTTSQAMAHAQPASNGNASQCPPLASISDERGFFNLQPYLQRYSVVCNDRDPAHRDVWITFMGLEIENHVPALPNIYRLESHEQRAIFVRGVPMRYTLAEFKNLFERYGRIDRCPCIIDFETQDTFRWVIMRDQESAGRVLKWTQLQMIDGRPLLTSLALPPGRSITILTPDSTTLSYAAPGPSHQVTLSNVSYYPPPPSYAPEQIYIDYAAGVLGNPTTRDHPYAMDSAYNIRNASQSLPVSTQFFGPRQINPPPGLEAHIAHSIGRRPTYAPGPAALPPPSAERLATDKRTEEELARLYAHYNGSPENEVGQEISESSPDYHEASGSADADNEDSGSPMTVRPNAKRRVTSEEDENQSFEEESSEGDGVAVEEAAIEGSVPSVRSQLLRLLRRTESVARQRMVNDAYAARRWRTATSTTANNSQSLSFRTRRVLTVRNPSSLSLPPVTRSVQTAAPPVLEPAGLQQSQQPAAPSVQSTATNTDRHAQQEKRRTDHGTTQTAQSSSSSAPDQTVSKLALTTLETATKPATLAPQATQTVSKSIQKTIQASPDKSQPSPLLSYANVSRLPPRPSPKGVPAIPLVQPSPDQFPRNVPKLPDSVFRTAVSSWARIASSPSPDTRIIDLHPATRYNGGARLKPVGRIPQVVNTREGESGAEQMRVVFLVGIPNHFTLEDISMGVREGPIHSIHFGRDDNTGKRFSAIVFLFAKDAEAFTKVLLRERADSRPERFRFIVDVARGDEHYPLDDILRAMGPPLYASRRLTIVKGQFFATVNERQLRLIITKHLSSNENKIQLIWLYNVGNATVVFADVESAMKIKAYFDRAAEGKEPDLPATTWANLTTTYSKDPCVLPLELKTDLIQD